MHISTKSLFGLLVVIIVGATVANLIALKIAGDQVQKSLKNNSSVGSILGALGGS